MATVVKEAAYGYSSYCKSWTEIKSWTKRVTSCDTVKLLNLIEAPSIYLNIWHRPTAFIRDPAYTGRPASTKTLQVATLNLFFVYMLD